MTLRFTALAGIAIFALATALPAAAQQRDLQARHDALLQDIMEEDGAFIEPSPYSQNPYAQSPYGQPQNPYGQTQNPYGQPQSPYSQTQNPYGQPQNPYGQNPYPQNPSGQMPSQNPYGQVQNPYGQMPSQSEQNSFGQPSGSVPGAQTIQVMDSQNPQGRPMVAFTHQIPAGWQSSGRINWQESGRQMCGLMTPNRNWTAQSPNGQEQMDLWPE